MKSASLRRHAALAVVALAGSAITVFAQEPPASKDDAAARLEEMTRIARAFAFTRDGSGTSRAVELKPEPLHRWNDPTRSLADGTLWAWGGSGRPIAMATLEFYPRRPDRGPFWSLEMVSLATVANGFEARVGAGAPGFEFVRWAPRRPGLEIRPLAGSPEPAATEAERLRQARALAARFSAEEVFTKKVGDERYALRLMPRPILTYSDPDSSILTGAIFLFANGTNPEIILCLEAAGKEPSAGWTYGVARVTRAAFEVRFDGKEAWSQPYAAAATFEDPYCLAKVPRETR